MVYCIVYIAIRYYNDTVLRIECQGLTQKNYKGRQSSMTFCNFSVRQTIAQRKLSYRSIAKFIGVTPEHLSRCMSKPLSVNMSQRILTAIDALTVEKDAHVTQ